MGRMQEQNGKLQAEVAVLQIKFEMTEERATLRGKDAFSMLQLELANLKMENAVLAGRVTASQGTEQRIENFEEEIKQLKSPAKGSP